MKVTKVHRRQFLGHALGLGGLAAVSGTATAQVTSGVHSSGRYDDSMIFERKRFTWPGGKTLAVWISPAVEVWSFDSANDAAIAPNGAVGNPDVINFATRDYGIRVGIWRIADVLDAAGIKATVALNSAVCQFNPKAIEALKKLQWEFIGHGVTNSKSLSRMAINQERNIIQNSLATIEKATGQKVRGWISPGQQETANTPDLLAEAGVIYTGDWNQDDQPVRMKVKSGEMYTLPYCREIDDEDAFSRSGFAAQQYYQAIIDQFDALYSDSQKHARVMGMPLHPFITGQPSHIKYVKQAIQYMKQRDRVWFATGSEIVDVYRKLSV